MSDLVRLRNVSRHDLSVAPLGHRVVGADCLVEVPREVFAAYVWPETVWRNETPAKKG